MKIALFIPTCILTYGKHNQERQVEILDRLLHQPRRAATEAFYQNDRQAASISNRFGTGARVRQASAGAITTLQLRKVLNDVSEKITGDSLIASLVEDYIADWLKGIAARTRPRLPHQRSLANIGGLFQSKWDARPKLKPIV